MKDCYIVVSELMAVLEKECRNSGKLCNNNKCPLYVKKKEHEKRKLLEQEEFERVRGED